MQGGDSLGLLDQGDILREEINEAVEKWLDDRTNPELVTILDGLIREVDLHVEKLGDVGILVNFDPSTTSTSTGGGSGILR